jgi:uracil-DNA glycosylase
MGVGETAAASMMGREGCAYSKCCGVSLAVTPVPERPIGCSLTPTTHPDHATGQPAARPQNALPPIPDDDERAATMLSQMQGYLLKNRQYRKANILVSGLRVC